MKKGIVKAIIIAIALVIITLVLTLIFTRPNYSKREIDYFTTAEGFSWDMSQRDASKLIQKLQKDAGLSGKIEIEDHTTYSIVSGGGYIFRFDSNGKLEFVKQKVPDIRNTITGLYGKCDKIEKAKAFQSDIYIWYGMMAGEKTEMNLSKASDQWYIEFSLR